MNKQLLCFFYQCFYTFNDIIDGMVSVAQLVEHQVVVLGVVGSIPIAHPIKTYFQSQNSWLKAT